jgi:hypothetical protein
VIGEPAWLHPPTDLIWEGASTGSKQQILIAESQPREGIQLAKASCHNAVRSLASSLFPTIFRHCSRPA